MKSVLLLTGSALSNNPRAWKEACALARAGYGVDVLGAWLAPVDRERDLQLLEGASIRFHAVLDVAKTDWRSRLQWECVRFVHRFGKVLFRFFGWENAAQIGLVEWPLRRAALRWPRPDLAIAHSEYALPVARLLRRRGVPVALDLEDWFSRDLPPAARGLRPVRLLEALERDLLTQGAYATCPSGAMSEAVARAYGCPRPRVVYNAFPLAETKAARQRPAKDRADASVVSVHWYSQTIGVGRGLEDLLRALSLMEQRVHVHLRGHCSDATREWLLGLAPEHARDRIYIHASVPPGELLARIAEHDIGFAGESPHCNSRDTTVTNKILHYLLAGLAVVASNTKGQAEIARLAPGAVRLYPPGDSNALARLLDELVSQPDVLRTAKRAAARAAESRFCWEMQEPVLLAAVAKALARAAPVKASS